MKWAHIIKKAISSYCWTVLLPWSVKVKLWLLWHLRIKPLSLLLILDLFQISFRLQSIPMIPIIQDFSHLWNTDSNASVCEPFPMTNDVFHHQSKKISFYKHTSHIWGCAYHLLTWMYTSQIRNMRRVKIHVIRWAASPSARHIPLWYIKHVLWRRLVENSFIHRPQTT